MEYNNVNVNSNLVLINYFNYLIHDNYKLISDKLKSNLQSL